jgi:hypothetical protein
MTFGSRPTKLRVSITGLLNHQPTSKPKDISLSPRANIAQLPAMGVQFALTGFHEFSTAHP